MDSPEYQTLIDRDCYQKLLVCVELSPDDIVAQLRPTGILAPGNLAFLSNPLTSKDQKARELVDVVLKQVIISSKVFHTFVLALQAAGPWTRAIVSKLKNKHSSLSVSTLNATQVDAGSRSLENTGNSSQAIASSVVSHSDPDSGDTSSPQQVGPIDGDANVLEPVLSQQADGSSSSGHVEDIPEHVKNEHDTQHCETIASHSGE